MQGVAFHLRALGSETLRLRGISLAVKASGLFYGDASGFALVEMLEGVCFLLMAAQTVPLGHNGSNTGAFLEGSGLPTI